LLGFDGVGHFLCFLFLAMKTGGTFKYILGVNKKPRKISRYSLRKK